MFISPFEGFYLIFLSYTLYLSFLSNEIERKKLNNTYQDDFCSIFISERTKADCFFLLKKMILSSCNLETLQNINFSLEAFPDCKSLMLYLEKSFNDVNPNKSTPIVGMIINNIAKTFVITSFFLIPNGIHIVSFIIFNMNLNPQLNLILKPCLSNKEKYKRFKLWNQISESLLLDQSNHIYDLFYGNVHLNIKTPIYQIMDIFLNQIRLELSGNSEAKTIPWSIISDKNNNLSAL
jgi:hypothetical protein